MLSFRVGTQIYKQSDPKTYPILEVSRTFIRPPTIKSRTQNKIFLSLMYTQVLFYKFNIYDCFLGFFGGSCEFFVSSEIFSLSQGLDFYFHPFSYSGKNALRVFAAPNFICPLFISSLSFCFRSKSSGSGWLRGPVPHQHTILVMEIRIRSDISRSRHLKNT